MQVRRKALTYRIYAAIASAGLIAAFAAGVSGYVIASGYAIPADIDYFVGTWTLEKEGANGGITWTVKEDLNKTWVTGVAEKNGERISTDYWRLNGKVIERHVFTNDGVFIKFVSSGWQKGVMKFNGIATAATGDFRMRETITKKGDRRFQSVRDKQEADGKWTLYSDETYSK